jgi:hypothetical protein
MAKIVADGARIVIDGVEINATAIMHSMFNEYREFVYQLKKNNRRAKRMRRHQRRAR